MINFGWCDGVFRQGTAVRWRIGVNDEIFMLDSNVFVANVSLRLFCDENLTLS